MTTKKKFHWFWAWDDEKEEIWLREMSKKGWHFKSVGVPGNYIFEQGKPIEYTYRLDYFIDRKDMSNYLQLFQDAGWSYLGEMGGWQYFRKAELFGEVQEIYSDRESKTKKYQRLMLYLTIFFPIHLSFILILSRSNDGAMQVFTFIMVIIMLVYVYAMVKLLRRITRLMKKI
jgi:hypothetical protein